MAWGAAGRSVRRCRKASVALDFALADEGPEALRIVGRLRTEGCGRQRQGFAAQPCDAVPHCGGAQDAVDSIEQAIQDVSEGRSKLGAWQNRLEHTIANLNNAAENLQAAESRIRDVDMAQEIMEYTKNNILQQAATAMLAQANMAPQSVLQLLG